MKIIHSGFDTISFAVQGELSTQSLKDLSELKKYAVAEQREVPVQLDTCKIPMNLMHHGLSGGYAYVLNSGDFGAYFSFEDNLDRKNWNGFVKIRSQALALYGWRKCINEAAQVLESIGFYILSVSINRVDYCIDFLNTGIDFEPKNFIAHNRVTKSTHYGNEKPITHLQKQSVSRSNKVESITLGKMPGRQVIIYDKRAEAIAKHKYYWFNFWNIDQGDITQTIHRVELRAGKKELGKYRIKTWEDFETRIGDVFNKAALDIRYISPCENDTNVSRYPNHPIWDFVTEHVKTKLLEHTSNIELDTIMKIT